MILEEYIVKHHATGYSANQIESLGFEASPSRAWSDETFEEFSAVMLYRVKGDTEVFRYSLVESEVCDFLNEMFPSANKEQ